MSESPRKTSVDLSACPHCDGTGYDPAGSLDPRDRSFGDECQMCEGTGDRYGRAYPRRERVLREAD